MSEHIEGGCRCGRVRYRIETDRFPNAYACHCRDCQTWSGSAFSLQFAVREDQLEVTGDPQLFELTSPDGMRISRQRGCPICFTRIFNTNTGRPGLAMVRAGTLDRSDEIEVAAHIWAKRRMKGILIPDGQPSWAENAPPGELLAALSR
ncbi:MAG TPA: GFA family protein [Allosphingosinicella sp.]|jgi:hypothetical protein